MKRMKRTIAPFTLASILGVQSLIIPVSVEAAPVSSQGSFKDVAKNHWATPYILKMGLRNVVAGYEDGTFKPDQRVTQLQAVSLAIRNMGLAEEAAKYENTAIPYTVPQWAKGSIALAISKGLIKPSEKNFSPNEDASRAWIAQLMVRMIGKESEVGTSTSTTVFTDAADVPTWAKEYVKTAVSYGIMSGYPESNGTYTFKPNYAVTRAQIVSVLSQSEKFIDVTSSNTQIGSLESITGSALTIVTSSGSKSRYTITSKTKFYKDNKEVTASILDADSQVMVIGENGTASYVEVVQNQAPQKRKMVKAAIEKVFTEAQTVVVRAEDGKLQTYAFASNAVLSSGLDKLQLSQLAKGDQVELAVDTDGKIVELKRTGASQEQGLAGNVYDIDKQNKLLTIKTASGKLEAYQYTDATYIEYKNKRFPRVEDLLPGDSVKLEVQNGAITKVIVADTTTGNQGELATVKVISVPDKFIALQNESGEMQAYTIASGATVSLSGAVAPTLADIKVGDKVEAKIENNVVVSIAIKNRTVQNNKDALSGSVFAIDTANRILSFKGRNGDLRAYEVLSTAQVLLNGTAKNLTDIRKDMNVSIQLNEDNKIISINADNRVRAEVIYVNTDDRLLTVKLETGETKVYVVDRNVDITIYDVSGEELRDLRPGDKIAMKLDTSKVLEIDVEKSYVYRAVEKSSSSSYRITAQDERGRSRDFTIDGSVVLTIPGIPYPKASDVKKGDVLRATYLGNTLKEVAVVPSVYGQITQVVPETNKIVVKDLNGATTEIIAGYGTIIQLGDRTYTNLTALQPGNRVQVAEAADGAKSIAVLQKIETTFTSLDPLGDRVYTAKGSYYLPDTLFNRQTQLQSVLNSLRRGDTMSIYLLNNEIYEIAKGK